MNAPDVKMEEFYIYARFWRGDGFPATDKGGKSGTVFGLLSCLFVCLFVCNGEINLLL